MDRKEKILNILKKTKKSVTGAELSEKCGVSRQIIVGDIALLRAQGEPIISTPRGYQIAGKSTGIRRNFVTRHGPELLEAELNAIVDNGGIVDNVVIEHDVYGFIEAKLNLHSRRDVTQFMKRMQETTASMLASISRGVHTHVVEARSEEDLDAIERALRDLGILYAPED